MKTAATLFSGGGGADLGLSAAGLDVKWGLEHDEEIAQVARDNGLNIHTADVTKVDPKWYERVDVLHASPPCPNFSVAKTGAEETDEDVSLAQATVRFVEEIEPSLFSLENVWGYRKSQSWKLIRECLTAEGYDWNGWHLNCADYGVPQTRKRMIVAARKRGLRPKKPTATHAEDPPSGGLFGDTLDEWVGWYEAISDLIPDLPETELADWQKGRLPDELLQNTIVDTQPNARGDCRGNDESTKSVDATHASNRRAVLVHGSDVRSMPTRDTDDASFSVIANGNQKGAGANVPRAVLVGTNTTDGETPPIRQDGPALTQRPNDDGRLRAVLVNESSTLEEREAAEPAASQVATERNHRQRAILRRRIVQMTPRALARFQTLPDWYELPDTKSLACRIIGNVVPPLAMKKWAQQWLTSSKDF
jgi:DNA (cytosine-5)-methyltransferase 1